MATASGGVDSSATIVVRSAGVDAEGGAFAVEAAGDVTLRGAIDASGGNGGGGQISIDCSGQVNLIEAIDAGASAAGPGGAIEVGSSIEPIALTIEGPLLARGNGIGRGGFIELRGRQTVQIGALLEASGGAQGRGGTIRIAASEGDVVVDDLVQAIGSGPNSAGGTIAIEAQGGISALQGIDASGEGGTARFCRAGGNLCDNDDQCTAADDCVTSGGGLVQFTAEGAVDLFADVAAGSAAGAGGRIEVRSGADVRIAAAVTTGGVLAPGGVVDALGCLVTVCAADTPGCPQGATGELSSLGPMGTNLLVGRGRFGADGDEPAVSVFGRMRAAVEDGANILGWRGSPPAFRPFAVAQNVIPAAREEVDASLVPCPLCGNRMEEPPETCDDGNRADGDGCSSSCQLEPGSTRTPTPTDTPAVTPTDSPTSTPTGAATPTSTLCRRP